MARILPYQNATNSWQFDEKREREVRDAMLCLSLSLSARSLWINAMDYAGILRDVEVTPY